VQIRVLAVDDEKDLVDYLTVLLSREGYQVDGVTDPSQVVAKLKEREYHLVVLDMVMPNSSGTEVLAEIRKLDSDLAVIVCTGSPSLDTAVQSLRHAASDYVRKPFDPPEFLATVKNVLARKGLSADPEADMHRAIGNTIREMRKGKNLTLKQLARRTGLSVSLLSQIERAESSASISSLYHIARALGMHMGQLFADT
jgi:DNA-binding response OmpR family regulator